MAKKSSPDDIQIKMLGLIQGVLLRQAVALEKTARIFADIEHLLYRIVDENDGSLRMKDIKRAEVYGKHLGKKLRKD